MGEGAQAVPFSPTGSFTSPDQAKDKARLEDIYLPHRLKRKTRGNMARERGLEPLANTLFAQRGVAPGRAKRIVNLDKDVQDVQDEDAALA